MKQRTKEILVYFINIFGCIFYYWIFLELKYKPQWFPKFIVFLLKLFPNRDIGDVIVATIVGLPLILILHAIDREILWERY